MKTFRFFATLLVIALCAGFTSCSDDDEEENSVEISLANLQGDRKSTRLNSSHPK